VAESKRTRSPDIIRDCSDPQQPRLIWAPGPPRANPSQGGRVRRLVATTGKGAPGVGFPQVADQNQGPAKTSVRVDIAVPDLTTRCVGSRHSEDGGCGYEGRRVSRHGRIPKATRVVSSLWNRSSTSMSRDQRPAITSTIWTYDAPALGRRAAKLEQPRRILAKN